MSTIKYLTFILFLFYLTGLKSQTPNFWTRVAGFGGIPTEAGVSFSIDSFGYVGLGEYENDSTYADIYPTNFWQYNPYTNVWTQKSSFPGAGSFSASYFVIGSKAYVGLGDGTGNLNNFWEYDPATDTWTEKAVFPGGGREGALAFSLGGKGYVGMGYSGSNVASDLWEYDPTNDSWTQLGNFPISGTVESALFTIGGYEYVGLGFNYALQTTSNALWQYDPVSDRWTQLANFTPDTLNGGALGGASFAFSIGDKGYLNVLYDSASHLGNPGGYISSYFYEYNPSSDTWVKKDSFPDSMIFGMSFFSIGNTGYAGIGTPNYLTNCSNDFWMYTPDSISTGIRNIDESNIGIYPNPTTDMLYISNLPSSATLTISDMTGRVYTTILSGQHIDVSALPAGVYCLHIQDSGGSVVRKFVKE